MDRYICIHGHFYQPPRDNPWLEAIELQDSAYPYHDWNERITSECYATNASSRILNDEGKVSWIVNNYSKISFNFGPTLLSWLEKNTPKVYELILDADRQSMENYSGHGSAMAQAFNHMILPLANRRDKITQIRWGIEDFEHRFGRQPEGMWLPEAAVDLEALDIMAEQGIKFTVLAPNQAKRIRPIGQKDWQELNDGSIDPTMAYVQQLPSGRSINLFFYDGPISRAVAFEGLLNKGETFAQRLLEGFSDERTWPQIVHIATDGESYGHHHRYGDMALAYALYLIESGDSVKLINYGEYLEMYPPTHEVEIHENSSWSCIHGVERWKSDCGCNSGGYPGWNQAWRGPLRDALDILRDTTTPAFERKAKTLFRDPWEARNDYIRVVLDRTPENIRSFLEQHAGKDLVDSEKIEALKLMELQRHNMLMYTSCGWFFDELSGIETVQVIQYAGRALQLAQELFRDEIESRFLDGLEQAKSNIPKLSDGRKIYERFVKPTMVNLEKVGAHYSMSSLFEEYEDEVNVFSYNTEREFYRSAVAGKAKLAVGRVKITSSITMESTRLCFGVLHWGDHIFSSCVRICEEGEPNENLVLEVVDAFKRADFTQTRRLLEQYFGAFFYSISTLFKDEQRKITNIILESTVNDTEAMFRQLYENHALLLRFLKNSNIPPPKAIYSAAEFIVNLDLKRAFEDNLDPDGIQNALEEADLEGIELDVTTLEIVLRRKMEHLASLFSADPEDISLLRDLLDATYVVKILPFEVNLRDTQNTYYNLLQNAYLQFRERAAHDEYASDWITRFEELGDNLLIEMRQDG